MAASGPGRVLVVDDNLMLAENIAEIIESTTGYPTTVSGTADEAMAQVSRGDVMLLVTDYRLEGTTGLDLMATSRRILMDLPTIVISGYMDHDMVAAAHVAGVLAVFPKPVAIVELVEAVLGVGSHHGAESKGGEAVPERRSDGGSSGRFERPIFLGDK